MPTYTISYFIKNATKFEEDSTVINMGNGWFRVVKTFEGWSQADAIEQTKSFEFPIGSIICTLSMMPLIQPKIKRKAAWKQNPLNRYSKGNK